MVHLDLTEEETRILAEMVEGCIEDLHSEITHTDNAEYKESLKQRRMILKKLSVELTSSLPETRVAV